MNIESSESECCCVCINEYNNKEHKAISLHTAVNGQQHNFCISCLFFLKNSRCPMCNESIDLKLLMNFIVKT